MEFVLNFQKNVIGKSQTLCPEKQKCHNMESVLVPI